MDRIAPRFTYARPPLPTKRPDYPLLTGLFLVTVAALSFVGYCIAKMAGWL